MEDDRRTEGDEPERDKNMTEIVTTEDHEKHPEHNDRKPE
jgi:hypothetical protein